MIAESPFPQSPEVAPERKNSSKLFRSFWMGGYESATHISHVVGRLDMIAGTQHDIWAEDDYALLKSAGMHTARDAVRWHLVDSRGGRGYDWSSFEPMFEAAQRQGIQIIWDVCHYGWPDEIDVFRPEFVDRFARFAGALARFIKERSDDVPFYSPMNEINFFAWGASRLLIYPFAKGRDNELKRQFARAAIAACEAMLEVDPRARFVYPEPTVQVFPPRRKSGFKRLARDHHESQFEAWDMIAGIQQPELGGKPQYLDILGSNFYHDNQWEVKGDGHLSWAAEPRDARWVPYSELLNAIYRRYRRPLFVAETSHFGPGRGKWILDIANEVAQARQAGTPVDGICIYPIIDRYDWNNPDHWHRSGFWELTSAEDGKLVRRLDRNYAEDLRRAQFLVS